MDNIHRLTPLDDRADIEQQAADWLVRLDSHRAPSPADLAELKAWLQRSPAHREQLKRLTQYWHSANLLTELSFPLPGSQRPGGTLANLRYRIRRLFNDRWQAAGALTATAALALGLLFGNPNSISGNGIYETRIGEQNSITLTDGSVVRLNTDSHIQVNYLDHQRNIVLIAGEAHFEVAKNKRRPFVVTAGDGIVRAVGTAFTLRLNPDALKVTVTEGKVALASNPQPSAPQMPSQDRGYLLQGQAVDFIPQANTGLGNQIQQLQQEDLDQQLAWHKGLLIFTGEPLAEVIAEVNRYTQLDIKIMDQGIANISIGGQFKVGETDAMLKVLETSFGINVTRPNTNTVHLRLSQ
jgi:transmembrane sensor